MIQGLSDQNQEAVHAIHLTSFLHAPGSLLHDLCIPRIKHRARGMEDVKLFNNEQLMVMKEGRIGRKKQKTI